jgi:hypothetical protein
LAELHGGRVAGLTFMHHFTSISELFLPNSIAQVFSSALTEDAKAETARASKTMGSFMKILVK